MNTPQNYWNQFKAAFCAALDETEESVRAKAWIHIREKTAFYEWTLMPAIKRHFGGTVLVERMRCDHTFMSDEGVPLVAVEVENAHLSAWHEMECLCSLAAPVKVLIISCDWQSEKRTCLPEWCKIIQKHHAVVSVECVYAIIVGEWDDAAPMEYSFTLLNPAGEVMEETKHVVA